MIKTTGAEWKLFYADPKTFPDGAYHEDEELVIDGKAWDWMDDIEFIPDDAQVTLSGGVFYLDGDATDGPSLETYFKRWKKRQGTAVLVITGPKEREHEVRTLLKAQGWSCK